MDISLYLHIKCFTSCIYKLNTLQVAMFLQWYWTGSMKYFTSYIYKLWYYSIYLIYLIFVGGATGFAVSTQLCVHNRIRIKVGGNSPNPEVFLSSLWVCSVLPHWLNVRDLSQRPNVGKVKQCNIKERSNVGKVCNTVSYGVLKVNKLVLWMQQLICCMWL